MWISVYVYYVMVNLHSLYLIIKRKGKMAVYLFIGLTIEGVRVGHKEIAKEIHKDEKLVILRTLPTLITILKETTTQYFHPRQD